MIRSQSAASTAHPAANTTILLQRIPRLLLHLIPNRYFLVLSLNCTFLCTTEVFFFFIFAELHTVQLCSTLNATKCCNTTNSNYLLYHMIIKFELFRVHILSHLKLWSLS